LEKIDQQQLTDSSSSVNSNKSEQKQLILVNSEKLDLQSLDPSSGNSNQKDQQQSIDLFSTVNSDKLDQQQLLASSVNSEKLDLQPTIASYSYVYILLEKCGNKSLMELLKKRKRLSETEVRYFMYQIISALGYMNDKKVIHRDLKLANLRAQSNIPHSTIETNSIEEFSFKN